MKLKNNYAAIVATLALAVALVGVPGVTAGGILVTSKQIKNNSITSKDLRGSAVKSSDLSTNAVQSTDIQTGAVTSADIGEGQIGTGDIGAGQVTPEDVTMPKPVQIQESKQVSIDVTGGDFVRVDTFGAYSKVDPTSAIQVSWTGTASIEHGTGCVFQLRIDGQASASGAGTVFVSGRESVSATALFAGFSPGPHAIEIWVSQAAPGSSRCVVGPSSAGIPQTFVVSEQVI